MEETQGVVGSAETGSPSQGTLASLREASTTSLVPVEIIFVLLIIQAGPSLVHCKNVMVISTLSGLSQLHLFRGFHIMHMQCFQG